MSTTIMLIGMGLGVVVAALLILAAKPRPQVSVTIRELDAKARQPYVEKEEWSRCIYTAGHGSDGVPGAVGIASGVRGGRCPIFHATDWGLA